MDRSSLSWPPESLTEGAGGDGQTPTVDHMAAGDGRPGLKHRRDDSGRLEGTDGRRRRGPARRFGQSGARRSARVTIVQCCRRLLSCWPARSATRIARWRSWHWGRGDPRDFQWGGLLGNSVRTVSPPHVPRAAHRRHHGVAAALAVWSAIRAPSHRGPPVIDFRAAPSASDRGRTAPGLAGCWRTVRRWPVAIDRHVALGSGVDGSCTALVVT